MTAHSTRAIKLAQTDDLCNCGPVSTVNEGPTPSYEAIASFMAQMAAKLPYHPNSSVRPHQYSGRDYAVILSACVPGAIDLSQLCWTTAPLAAQRSMNLNLFCQAAARIEDVNTPLSSLHAHLLQPSALHTWHHLKVQHWLYTLSFRWTPSPDFDPSQLRLLHRQKQVGEPFSLHFTRKENFSSQCSSLTELKALEPVLLSLISPLLVALESSLAAPQMGVAGTKLPEAEFNELPSPSPPTITEKRRVPSYSKPWNLPAINAAKKKKEKEEETIKKRLETARRVSVRLQNSVFDSCSNIGDQLFRTSVSVKKMRCSLHDIHKRVVDSIMKGEQVNFNLLAIDLEKSCEESTS